MTNLKTTHTAVSLGNLTLKEITAISNEFATNCNEKTVIRFSTKPAAITKALYNQLAYNNHTVRDIPAPADKPQVNYELGENHPNIVNTTSTAVIISKGAELGTSRENLIKYVAENYIRPSTERALPRNLICRRIGKALAAGYIVIV